MLNFFSKEPPQIVEPISNINTLVRAGNDYFSEELIILDERLNGNLFCTEKVAIEQNGALEGNITSKACIVSGTVNGDILALDILEINATAVVRGNIQSAAVYVEPGAIINGRITVGEDIDKLTRQWNKTKFSTDEHLSAGLTEKLSEINQVPDVADIIVEPVKPPEPVVLKEEEVPSVQIQENDITATQPQPAATPPPKQEGNNQRWW